MIDTIAATALARLVAVTLAERLPGGPPPGIHDPALFVDRAALVRECARHGVAAAAARHPPVRARPRAAGWPARRDIVRMVPVPTTAVLFQAVGRRRRACGGQRGTDRWQTTAYIAGLGVAVPGQRVEQADLWDGPLRPALRRRPAAERIFLGAGVRHRHAAVNPLVEDASPWSTGRRMRRYVTEALPLGKEAVAAALADAGLAPDDIGLFAVVSCTGYATPGLDIRIAADLGHGARRAAARRRAHGLLRGGARRWARSATTS